MRARKATLAGLLSAAFLGTAGRASAMQQRWAAPLRRSQWHNPARVEAAEAKRDRRAWRDIAIANKGGIGFTKAALAEVAANGV